MVISGTTGDAVRDEQLRAAALEASGVTGGDTVSTASLAVSLDRIRALDGVVGADTRREAGPSGATLLFAVTLGSKPLQAEAAAPVFPVLYRDSRSMLKLTMNGGIGLNSDTNAFFRNWEAFNASSPIAPGPPTGLNVTFTDVSIEPGIGGITRLGQQPVYVYGAATVVASGTLGPDIYQRNERCTWRSRRATAACSGRATSARW